MEGLTPLSVIILTKDEEALIERCIRSVDFAAEFVVVDCGSTDRTREIAAAAGARVLDQPWLGWSAQRNAGAAAASHDWVFCLEADEVVSPELARSFRAMLSGPLDPRDAYSLTRRDDHLGVLLPNDLRRSTRSTFVRVYNRTESAWNEDDLVHERVVHPGRAIPLDGVLVHWRGSPMDELASTANRYATVEADVLERDGARAGVLDLAVRPIVRFLWSYVWKGAWRLGTRGLNASILKAIAEWLRWAKLWERQNVRDAEQPPDELVNR
jgi:(heptosyl)LPS beta-1,4-glucosyltransferase